jgi:hypothetical protein
VLARQRERLWALLMRRQPLELIGVELWLVWIAEQQRKTQQRPVMELVIAAVAIEPWLVWIVEQRQLKRPQSLGMELLIVVELRRN